MTKKEMEELIKAFTNYIKVAVIYNGDDNFIFYNGDDSSGVSYSDSNYSDSW